MKGVLLWTVGLVFMWLTITAATMGEYAIATVMGVICLVVLWAAPMGAPKTKKAKR